MTTQAISHEAPVAAGLLSGTFTGRVYLPGEAEYDVQRRPLMPTMDPRPLVVAEAAGPADVQAAVVAAWRYGLPFAVQATGHGTRIPSDGGVLLKTSAMTSILVDPQRRIAKVGPGARWGAIARAAVDLVSDTPWKGQTVPELP
jgi:FAD/FMN-containing dehydrogenase